MFDWGLRISNCETEAQSGKGRRSVADCEFRIAKLEPLLTRGLVHRLGAPFDCQIDDWFMNSTT